MNKKASFLLSPLSERRDYGSEGGPSVPRGEERIAFIEYDFSKGKYCVLSPDNPDWSAGCYEDREEAEKRLKQVEFFKHIKKKPKSRK